MLLDNALRALRGAYSRKSQNNDSDNYKHSLSLKMSKGYDNYYVENAESLNKNLSLLRKKTLLLFTQEIFQILKK